MNSQTTLGEKFAIERVVTVLTPLFGAASALITRLIVTALPSAHVSSGDLTALEITAFSWASGVALHWLHGRKQGWLVGLKAATMPTMAGPPGPPGPMGLAGSLPTGLFDQAGQPSILGPPADPTAVGVPPAPNDPAPAPDFTAAPAPTARA